MLSDSPKGANSAFWRVKRPSKSKTPPHFLSLILKGSGVGAACLAPPSRCRGSHSAPEDGKHNLPAAAQVRRREDQQSDVVQPGARRKTPLHFDTAS